MDAQPSLSSLPNELLISILSHLPAVFLLPVITVSHRFYSTVLRIFKERLNRALSQPDHRLMLECYHPTEKLYTPYLFCQYLSTDSFAAVEAQAAGGTAQPPHPPHQLDGLRGIYSHFRPLEEHDSSPDHAPEQPRHRHRHRHRSGDRDGRTDRHGDQADQTADPPPPPPPPPRPWIDVHLDDDESFAQLCAVTNLVQTSGRPGLFLRHVNVADGVVRAWRGWLAARARARARERERERETHLRGASGNGGGGGGGGGDDDGDDETVLWADAARDTGVRFRVAEKDIRGEHHHPVLVASDEQLPVAYRLEFEELLVRSSALLVAMEKAAERDVDAEGKAIVLAMV